MENIKKTSWIKGLLQDERGVPSSKRFVGKDITNIQNYDYVNFYYNLLKLEFI